MLPKNVTNYGTLNRNVLKNGMSGNFFTLPPLANNFLGKKD